MSVEEFLKNEGFNDLSGEYILEWSQLKQLIKDFTQPLRSALEDIRDWDQELNDDWGDPGERAKDALNY